jgi:hypothetical protein
MERDTYVQEWLQGEIEAVVLASGFKIINTRPLIRKVCAIHCLASAHTHNCDTDQSSRQTWISIDDLLPPRGNSFGRCAVRFYDNL